MNKVRTTINALATVLFTLLLASAAQAQATRTWVSGVGDDVNPCSRTAPCKTYAGAISKTAAGGEISTLDPGGFGAVTITKSILIDGTTGAGFGSILAAGTNGVNVNDSATASPNTIIVTLRNLSINGAGNTPSPGLVGVNITSAKKVMVENCTIFGFKGGNANGIRDTRNVSSAGGASLTVRDSIIRDNGQSGITILNTVAGANLISASLDNVRLDNNGNAGLAASSRTRVTVSNSQAYNNTNAGFFVDGPGAAGILNLETCVSVNNGQGVTAQTGGTVRLSNCHIANNSTGVSAGGGTFVTHQNNKITGNGAGDSLAAVGAVPVNPQ